MQLIVDILKTIIIGIVQGITEWLPISSTGHIILCENFLNFSSVNITAQFKEMFEVVIQFGSILAVLVLFFHKLNPFSPQKNFAAQKETFSMWGKVIVAAIPAAVIGLLLDNWFNEHFYNVPVVSATLIIYGILFIVIETINKRRAPSVKRINELSYQTAFLIGVFQILSLVPGTSRSGSTILAAIMLGCSRYIAAEFSFFLAIPVMFGASFLKIVKFFAGSGAFTAAQLLILFIGMLSAFAVSLFAIKFLMSFIKKHDFKPFGYYRIALGILLIILMAAGVLHNVTPA